MRMQHPSGRKEGANCPNSIPVNRDTPANVTRTPQRKTVKILLPKGPCHCNNRNSYSKSTQHGLSKRQTKQPLFQRFILRIHTANHQTRLWMTKLYLWKWKKEQETKKQIDKAFENQEICQSMSCSSLRRQKQTIQNKRPTSKLSWKHEQKALMETLGKERPFLPLASVNNARRTKQPSLHPASSSVEGRHEAGNDRAKAVPTQLLLREVSQDPKDRSVPLEPGAATRYSLYGATTGSAEELQTTRPARRHRPLSLHYKQVKRRSRILNYEQLLWKARPIKRASSWNDKFSFKVFIFPLPVLEPVFCSCPT